MRPESIARYAIDVLPKLFQERLDLMIRPLSVKRSMEDAKQLFDLVFEIPSLDPELLLFVELKPRALSNYFSEFASRSRALSQENELAIPLLFIPRLSEKSRRLLRESKLNHADSSGILYIRNQRIAVDLDGIDHSKAQSLSRSNVNPFSDKASLVLRMLLEKPIRPWRVTEISDNADLTKGWVSIVSRELVERGYVSETKIGLELQDVEAVLEDWSTHYQWKRNRVESYVAPFDYIDLLGRLIKISDVRKGAALTLHSGADQVAPHVQHGQVHLYVGASGYHLPAVLRENLHLERTPSGGNLHLVEPYYRRSVFVGKRFVNGLPIVSDVQLYLDLISSPIRGHEAAHMLLQKMVSDS